jgi:NAD(P)-dependent dehydrogenase (short-subunit alcohol dehydrogenase family)
MKNVMIVGSNRGIGLALVKAYAQNAKVTALCRKTSKDLSAIDNINIIENADVSNTSSLDEIAKQLEGQEFDLLIHVSGIWRDDNLFDDVNWDYFTESFEVNSIAPLKTVSAFKSLLSKNSKIGLMSSRMGSVEDNTSGDKYSYRMSKSALNCAGKGLSIDLKNDGISVAVLHPGYVQTDMTSGSGNLTPKESAEGIKKVMDKLSMENTGRFYHTNGEQLPW